MATVKSMPQERGLSVSFHDRLPVLQLARTEVFTNRNAEHARSAERVNTT